jgi:hypothetical protein
MPQAVTDARSNSQDQIAHAAKVIGRSPIARAVFEAIYNGKQHVKTVGELAAATKLTRKQVLTYGKKFDSSHLVEQIRKGGDTAYKKDSFYHCNKQKILALAGNKKKLEKFPTKTNPLRSTTVTVTLRLRPDSPPPIQVTVDEIDSFMRVRTVAPCGNLPTSVSENAFKHGVREILGEIGKFSDWGGERNDLFSTRIRIKGKRLAVAFAFKGPGTKGVLVPGKLGKNGDQIQRLFETDADAYLIQYWREINESVLNQMYAMAVKNALHTRRRVYYGLIDGQDSNRLRLAYAKCFA